MTDARGFSLLELLLVLTLAALAAFVALPTLPGALDAARLRGSAGDVRATLNLARTLAVSDARDRSVRFDLESGEYGIAGDARKWFLPENVRLASVRVGDAAAERGVVRVRFYADGSADDAEVALSSREGGRFLIRVDPLTGLPGEGT